MSKQLCGTANYTGTRAQSKRTFLSTCRTITIAPLTGSLCF